jgi:hypothetical protein
MQVIIQTLEKNVLDKDLADDVRAEKDHDDRIQGSIHRMEHNQYDNVQVGDYAERAKNRIAEREKKRAIYEVRHCCVHAFLRRHSHRLSG